MVESARFRTRYTAMVRFVLPKWTLLDFHLDGIQFIEQARSAPAPH
jgi:hypothetical protein